MTEPKTPDEFRAPSKRTILETTGIAAGVAVLVLVFFILPAEYGIDPTGFGSAIGINAMAAPGDAAFSVHNTEDDAFRADTVEVVVQPHRGLEYKFRLDKGSALVYSWNATGPLFFDFHGEPEGDTTGYFESYEVDTRGDGDGSFTAPFAGTHGWYWRNDGSQAVTVTLSTAGFYEVVGIK